MVAKRPDPPSETIGPRYPGRRPPPAPPLDGEPRNVYDYTVSENAGVGGRRPGWGDGVRCNSAQRYSDQRHPAGSTGPPRRPSDRSPEAGRPHDGARPAPLRGPRAAAVDERTLHPGPLAAGAGPG